MGKQIRFCQTDNDILNFRIFLKKHNLILFHYDKSTEVSDDISIWGDNRLFFVGTFEMQERGSLVEYHLPSRDNNRLVPECKIGIAYGRFYLSDESYDDKEATKVYNMLKGYIKKNYIYSKDASAYFSNDFTEMYKTYKYHLTGH